MLPIDLIVPFVDCSDKNWQSEYEKVVGKPFDECRYRDMGLLKYLFRSIEQNMPWIRQVFLVVESIYQLPAWITRFHPKLNIIYHRDYIPRSFLPTFNSNVIELFYGFIDELSENFILANDDILITKPMKPEDFFRDGRPVQKFKAYEKPIDISKPDVMTNTLLNNIFLESVYLNKPHPTVAQFHLLYPYSKNFWNKTLDRFSLSINAALRDSPIRDRRNVSHWLISDLQILTGYSEIDDALDYRGYMDVYDDTPIEHINHIISETKMVCLNDHIEKNPNKLKEITDLLDTIFPNKSSFEI